MDDPTFDQVMAPPPPPTPAPPPAPETVPSFDDVLHANEDEDRFKVAVGRGFETDPQRAAKVLGLQARTQLPTDLIDRHLDEVQQAATQGGFDPAQYRRDSPVVGQWLS